MSDPAISRRHPGGQRTELADLMELNAEGDVKLHAQHYKLADINTVTRDLKNRQSVGAP